MNKDNERLWIDRLGVRMEEPRDRFVINEEQVMTSVEYTGPYKMELSVFRDVIEQYFWYSKECRQAATTGAEMPTMPTDLEQYIQLEGTYATEAHGDTAESESSGVQERSGTSDRPATSEEEGGVQVRAEGPEGDLRPEGQDLSAGLRADERGDIGSEGKVDLSGSSETLTD